MPSLIIDFLSISFNELNWAEHLLWQSKMLLKLIRIDETTMGVLFPSIGRKLFNWFEDIKRTRVSYAGK